MPLAHNSVIPTAPLLKVPLFPGAHHQPLAQEGPGEALSDAAVDALIERVVGLGLASALTRAEFRRTAVDGWRYIDPFSGKPISIAQAVDLCGFWRQLIESNRDIAAVAGIAFWKRETVVPLLWSGTELPIASRSVAIEAGKSVAAWKSRTPPALLRSLEERGVTLVEVEDGFIRSSGLGADCVPPLSIVLDRRGVHFDPSRPSDLEHILQCAEFSAMAIERARKLRTLIVDSGISKYGAAAETLERRGGDRQHVLVPGQVEDDRSVLEGGGAVRTNLDLLQRARQAAPNSYIIYKPHPDIEAGHRAGALSDDQCLAFADEVLRDAPISSVIAMVDALQVNTSLAGFEALLRGKSVTTHGVPFYAGWGLTTDMGQVPSRRTRKLSLDALVAGVLLEYPRYLDPVTGLPCPAEVVVERLSGGTVPDPTLIVTLRRVQGKLMRRLRSLVQ